MDFIDLSFQVENVQYQPPYYMHTWLSLIKN